MSSAFDLNHYYEPDDKGMKLIVITKSYYDLEDILREELS